ncbi:hypothetical protein RDI58_003926 [Solanum bulbocastanum]|uniref:peptidylprolyl isomerase n=1 Tax=Solanum bulbocastanum TaxID=147425 RepID=A0AAN8YKT3_SOLBU
MENRSAVANSKDINESAKSSQIHTLPDGPTVEVMVKGKADGKVASPGKQIKIHFIAKLRDTGCTVGSTIGAAPHQFCLGFEKVLKGLNIGIEGMQVGEKRRLTIPPSLGWKTSLDLAKALCDVQLKKVRMSKRKRANIGDFPSPRELASFREEELKGKGKFGYRATDLIKLAKQVVDEKIKFDSADEGDYSKLKINGVGPFTTNTIMMCIGHYHNIPIDTETLRHMKEFHGLNMRKRKKGPISVETKAKIQEFYKIYHPFESLAYWFELANSYEIKLGKTLGELLPSEYHHATGSKKC